MPTVVPIRVVITRVSAAMPWLPAARISMPLIGVSSAWSPSRNTRAASSARPMTRPRDHHVRPTHRLITSAMPMPVSTAPTRTMPMRNEPDADACSTSSAVSAPVRSTGPSVNSSVSRYDRTPTVVIRTMFSSTGSTRSRASGQVVG